jgi:hypothetical protein
LKLLGQRTVADAENARLAQRDRTETEALTGDIDDLRRVNRRPAPFAGLRASAAAVEA